MLAFVLMIPLALTSTKSSIRRLGGQRWNQLHRLVYVTAVAGCVHYLWAVKKDIAEPLLYAAVFVVLFVLRLVLRKPGPRPSRPLPPPTPVPSPGS
jgi:sulfoxide reductase heme-binding subunit YedZ